MKGKGVKIKGGGMGKPTGGGGAQRKGTINTSAERTRGFGKKDAGQGNLSAENARRW